MKFWRFPLVLIGFAVFLLFCAESSSALTCSVSCLPDGSFRYQLSEGASLPSCDTCWMDDNKIVIARDSEFNKNLTVVLTNQSITLKTCIDHLHYTQECDGNHEDAHCRVNCSDLHTQNLKPTVNSTWVCFMNWCLEKQTVTLGTIGILLLVGVFVVCYFIFKYGRRRRGRQSGVETLSYTPATQQLKMKDTDVV